MFLCSDLASNITGAQYVVDGGRTATGGAVTNNLVRMTTDRRRAMITAIVLYDLPAHIDREACRQHFLKIAPDFLDVPGFVRKQFIHDVNGGVAGGSYIWKDLASAKAFYNGRGSKASGAAMAASHGSAISRRSPSPIRAPGSPARRWSDADGQDASARRSWRSPIRKADRRMARR